MEAPISFPATRQYYQDWYTRHAPESYDQHKLWVRYQHRLQALINSLATDDLYGLEVGSGGGHLQHMLRRYVGIDVASSAGRFMQQPFCAASALQLPFADATFDLVWSIWTLEHVIDPVRMLTEMLRVTRPGGFLFLCAAWFVPDWATRGYHSGSWHRTDIISLILRLSTYPRRWMGWPYILLSRLWWLTRGELQHLPYRFLLPNYTTYHAPDADACVHLEAAAVILWFRTHGAVCVSHPKWWHILTARHDEPLIFRVL